MKTLLSVVTVFLVVMCGNLAYAGEAEFIKAMNALYVAVESNVEKEKILYLYREAESLKKTIDCDGIHTSLYCAAVDAYWLGINGSGGREMFTVAKGAMDNAHTIEEMHAKYKNEHGDGNGK